MKRIIYSSFALAGLSLTMRTISQFAIDPQTGYGPPGTEWTFRILLFSAFALYCFTIVKVKSGSLPEFNTVTISLTQKAAGLICGSSILVAGFSSVIQVILEGNLRYFFCSRADLISYGIIDASFGWRFLYGILSIPGALWILKMAFSEKETTCHTDTYASIALCVSYVFRTIAQYMHDGANPHDQNSTAFLVCALITSVLCTRFSAYINSEREAKLAKPFLSCAVPALICASIALPAGLFTFRSTSPSFFYVLGDLAFVAFSLFTVCSGPAKIGTTK